MNKTYSLEKTDLFEKKFKKLIPDNKKTDINRRIEALSESPYVGRPLGYAFLRELKLDKFRIYFFIYEKEIIVLLVNVSDKKAQKETIKRLKETQHIFYDLVQKNLNKTKPYR